MPSLDYGIFELVGAADAVKSLLGESMRMWKTHLVANGKNFRKANIRQGIFQGDSLSPLLYIIALTPSMVLRKVSAGYGMAKGR